MRGSGLFDAVRRARASPFAPWLAVLGLFALFELPTLLIPEPYRPTGELVLLVTLLVLAGGAQRMVARLAGGMFGVLSVVLLVYRLDRVVFRLIFGDEALLYDQFFMLRHLAVLFSDVWSAETALVLAAIALVLWSLYWTLRSLARAVLPLAQPARAQRTRVILVVAWLAVLLGSALPKASASARPWVEWASLRLARNLATSVATYDTVQRDLSRSSYASYARLPLPRRPDVYLVMVESYGRVVIEHPAMRTAWQMRVDAMEHHLADEGWYCASAFSRAPVLGGRSWLAEASVLMGARVRYEAVFRQLVAQIDRVATLPRFLRAHGYSTLLLAPADRVRPGVEEVDYYHYDRSVRFADLQYRGPHWGWGVVPDQYSIDYVAEHVLPAQRKPRFFDFHMVSSHAPWEQVPSLVDDYHTLNDADGAKFQERDATSVKRRLARYLHEERTTYMGAIRAKVAWNYRRSILYDLEVLERWLARSKDDALVILLGDHQPPFLAAETESFDTPIHVLARDPRLLGEFLAHGFRPGLRIAGGSPARVMHQGLYSLVVRSLVSTGGASQLPEYREQGVPLGD